jgi:hypothetical protein
LNLSLLGEALVPYAANLCFEPSPVDIGATELLHLLLHFEIGWLRSRSIFFVTKLFCCFYYFHIASIETTDLLRNAWKWSSKRVLVP